MFVNTFGMKCSTENFKRLIPKLENLGYRLSVPTYNKDSIIIREQRNWEFTDLDKRHIEYEYFEKFNEDLLLALAAMTEGDTPIVGEYMIALKAGGWGYDNDNDGCLIQVKSLGSRDINTKEVIAIDGKIVNPNTDSCINFKRIPVENREGQRVFRKATKEELINHFRENAFSKKQETTMKVTRGQLKEIHDIACGDWKTKISQLTRELLGDFGKEAKISEEKVEEMFQAATKDQLPTLERIFPLRKKAFIASDLEVGEMMEVTEDIMDYKGQILLRIYGRIISITDPRNEWDTTTKLKGRKLNPGETVTIKQP